MAGLIKKFTGKPWRSETEPLKELCKILDFDSYRAFRYRKEIEEDTIFLETLKRRMSEWKSKGGKIKIWMNPECSKFLYVFCRLLQPEVVIETGVGPGSTSSFLLMALKRNGRGRLYSVDFPGHYTFQLEKDLRDTMPDTEGYRVGWLVPEKLRQNWSITLGDSNSELPNLLRHIGTADIFLHDSLHTYEHMMFEFQSVWPHIARGGLLLSDDVEASLAERAFERFCIENKIRYTIIQHRLGAARKQ